MAKPIMIINYCISGMSRTSAINNLRELQEVLEDSNANDEYFTFILPVNADSHIQVFYEKDYDEIKYNDLKKMVEEKISALKDQPDCDEIEEFDESLFEEEPSGFKKFLRKIGLKWWERSSRPASTRNCSNATAASR